MVQIAQYDIGVKFRFDQKEQRKLDGHLKALEKKFKVFSDKKLSFEISNFLVDQKKLQFALGNALDVASNRVVFQVSKFVVDQSRLNAMMRNAMQRATSGANASVNVRTNVQQPHVSANRVARNAAGGGAVGGLMGRGLGGFYAPALALAGGGYGLSQLNQRNQQVVSAQLQTAAVVQQAGGTAAQGAESFDFLRNQANRIGFNYLEASGDYNKLISGLTGAGVGLQESQNVFKGFAELARVNKLDKTTQNRLFRALSQVAGKGKLQAEELTGQIARILALGVEKLLENLSKCWELKLA
ncbi:hypothetical protein D3C85_173440 [compost metagenome]